jgi:hypothetical protein
MKVSEQREILRSLEPGDVVTVRDTSRLSTYDVTGVTGNKAPEIRLRGERGAKRTLVDGLHVVWMRSQTKRGPTHRRVLDLEVVQGPAPGQFGRPGRTDADARVTFDPGMELAEAIARSHDKPAYAVDHPIHYGGDTVYETIKVIEAWGLGFHLGSAVKCISRAGRKDPDAEIEDLEKARWYLDRKIARLRGEI